MTFEQKGDKGDKHILQMSGLRALGQRNSTGTKLGSGLVLTWASKETRLAGAE